MDKQILNSIITKTYEAYFKGIFTGIVIMLIVLTYFKVIPWFV